MKQVLETLVAEMLEQNVCLDKAVVEIEKQFLEIALRRSGGNQCKAAQLLHIHRNTLARKIVQHKIKPTDGPRTNRQRTIVALVLNRRNRLITAITPKHGALSEPLQT